MLATREKTGFFLPTEGPDRQPESQYFAGIDIGSRATKAVILKEDRILASTILNTGANVKKAAERSLALEDFLGKPITPLDIDPQLTGALGAAVLAQQPIREERISA